MKTLFVATIAVLTLSAGAAAARALSDNPPTATTICLEAGGQQRAAVCKAHASRLDATEDICQCGGAAQRVTITVCPAGVSAPGESAAYEQARLKAVSHGSLVGATWQGQPMCVAPRNRGDR